MQSSQDLSSTGDHVLRVPCSFIGSRPVLPPDSAGGDSGLTPAALEPISGKGTAIETEIVSI